METIFSIGCSISLYMLKFGNEDKYVEYVRKNKLDAKIVMITGYTEIDKSFMEVIGVDEYLTKPVKLTDIDAVIEKYSKK